MWYAGSPEIDEEIKTKFQSDVEAFARGEYDHWATTPKGVTSICILGDQFTRNVYRGSGQAFSLDKKVLSIVLKALEAEMDKDLHYIVRSNWYLPLMHSENKAMLPIIKGKAHF